jgi:hypothetical protein
MRGLRRIAPEIARLDRKARPSLSITGALRPSRLATRAPSSVADITRAADPRAGALRIERQREAEIGVQRALVNSSNSTAATPVQFRIVEDHAGEDALGDDLDARCARSPSYRAGRAGRPSRRPSRPASAMRAGAPRAASRRGSSIGPVDVAQVDNHRPLSVDLMRHEIERAEGVPFGDDDQRIGALRRNHRHWR